MNNKTSSEFNYRQRINYVYKNLSSIVSLIYNKNSCNIDQIIKFKININKILPITPEEKLFYNTIRELYKTSPSFFIQNIMQDHSKLKSLILLTDVKEIKNYFNIDDFIFISWNYEKRLYHIDISKKYKEINKNKDTLSINDSIDRNIDWSEPKITK